MARRGGEDLEKKALEIIRSSKDGVLQSNLWKMLGVTSKEVARIVLNLERKGLIRRERILQSNRWTYRITIVDNKSSRLSIESAPCILCEKDSLCGVGGDLSHLKCKLLEEWILRQGGSLAD